MTRVLAPIIVLSIASIAIVEGFTTTAPKTMSNNNNISNKADAVEGARQSTELYFGIPTFGKKDEDDEQEENQKDLEKPSVGLKGLVSNLI
jgi:hypothetical protein